MRTNVFTKLDENRYSCNGCGEKYLGENKEIYMKPNKWCYQCINKSLIKSTDTDDISLKKWNEGRDNWFCHCNPKPIRIVDLTTVPNECPYKLEQLLRKD